MTRGLKVKVKCKECKVEFEARQADVNRGWGKYCSKSCKSKKQHKKMPFDHELGCIVTGTKRKLNRSYDYRDDYDPSWDGHK
jgi:hypothetical protein